MKALTELLHEGDTIYQMMQVTGEEGITLEDFVKYQKSMLVDMAYLQQDAFDAVDSSMSTERQLASLTLLQSLVEAEFEFEDLEQARDLFVRLTSLYKNWNYAAEGTPDYERYESEIRALASSAQAPDGEETQDTEAEVDADVA